MTGEMGITRRRFLAAVACAGAAQCLAAAEPAATTARSRVVVIRHESLAADGPGPDPSRIRELLDEAARALAGDAKAADAWARWFKPSDRIGVKVNCLGYPTRPAVALGLAAAVEPAGLAPDRIILWDRTSRELRAAGYDLNASARGVRCFGTDSLSARGGGYTDDVFTSGATGSLLSRIVTDETTALVSAAVLKDHNLAGLTCAMKNFYGAIHNPNKYHDNNCDPFIADVCAQDHVRRRLRLAVIDAIRPQADGGPASRPARQWPYGGIIISTDVVAADRVALEILERRRAAAGLAPLQEQKRPARYLASAQARGLGTADLERIEVVSLGRQWLDVS